MRSWSWSPLVRVSNWRSQLTNTSAFPGLVAVLLAIYGVVTGRRERQSRAVIRVLLSLLIISYLLALVAYLAPHRWNLDPQLMFSLCPLYFVKMTFDPSLVTTFFLLAPMNAGVYGSLGLTLGYAWLAFRKPTSS